MDIILVTSNALKKRKSIDVLTSCQKLYRLCSRKWRANDVEKTAVRRNIDYDKYDQFIIVCNCASWY